MPVSSFDPQPLPLHRPPHPHPLSLPPSTYLAECFDHSDTDTDTTTDNPCAGIACGEECYSPCPDGMACAAVLSFCQPDGSCGMTSDPECPDASLGSSSRGNPKLLTMGALGTATLALAMEPGLPRTLCIGAAAAALCLEPGALAQENLCERCVSDDGEPVTLVLHHHSSVSVTVDQDALTLSCTDAESGEPAPCFRTTAQLCETVRYMDNGCMEGRPLPGNRVAPLRWRLAVHRACCAGSEPLAFHRTVSTISRHSPSTHPPLLPPRTHHPAHTTHPTQRREPGATRHHHGSG